MRLIVSPESDAEALVQDLTRLAVIEAAYIEPQPAPSPAQGKFASQQGYLNPAPSGIDAAFGQTIPREDGNGIKIIDIEYAWNQTHEDLSQAAAALIPNKTPAVPDFSGIDDEVLFAQNHGTAVLGEIVADRNGFGVTGISFRAGLGLVNVYNTESGYDLADAINIAHANLRPGDVMLIAQQTAGPAAPCSQPGPFLPVEFVQAYFDAIQMATTDGIVVVAPAGNGGCNLDDAAYEGRFNKAVRDSGAIMVGAGSAPGCTAPTHARLAFSTYGSRVDLQGWGECVVTAGYGDLTPGVPDPNQWYTGTFNGTSSASSIVAGAVAALQGITMTRQGKPLSAVMVRDVLVATGTPQDISSDSGHIGPLPNVRAAATIPLDVYFMVDLSGSFSDDLPGFKVQAPSIIATLKASHPNIRFGLGKFEDYPIVPFGDSVCGDKAYERLVDLTFDTDTVLNTIAGLFTRCGSDQPQSQLVALFQAATGAGQDLAGQRFPAASIPPGQQANFREGATKLILLWTDAAFHGAGDPGAIPYPGPSFQETINALLALDPPLVIGISPGGGGSTELKNIAAATGTFAPPGGVDCNGDRIIDIPEGEPLVCNMATTGAGIGEAIITLVDGVTGAIDNPLVANAGADQIVAAGAGCRTAVTLDGTGSTAPDGDSVTYTWAGLFGTASGPTPTITLPLGTNIITLTVDDGKGGTSSDTVTVSVVDTTAPVIGTVTATPNVLWPPNHKIVPVSVSVSVSDTCDAAPISKIISVSSSEPIEGTGDGDTAPDWQITGNLTLNLRAERAGKGKGRIYTIMVGSTDASSNLSTKAVIVTVPHDQKK